jgi:hypothetical protein
MKIDMIKTIALSLGALMTTGLMAQDGPKWMGGHGRGPQHGMGMHKGGPHGWHRGHGMDLQQEYTTLPDMISAVSNNDTKKELLDKIERAKALRDEREENQGKNQILYEEEVRYLQEVRKALGLPSLPTFGPDQMGGHPGRGPRHPGGKPHGGPGMGY